jgi:membrane dipeptidase
MADGTPPSLPKIFEGLPVFDGHNDTLLRIWDQSLEPQGFLDGFEGEGTAAGHLDLPRARRGGFCGGFFAMFVPSKRRARATRVGGAKRGATDEAANPDPADEADSADSPAQPAASHSYHFPYPSSIPAETALPATEEMLQLARLLDRSSEGRFRIVESIGDLDRAVAGWNPGGSKSIEGCQATSAGSSARIPAVAAILHLEGAEAVHSDLSNLEALYHQGVRSIGPVWSRANDFAHGVPFAFPCSPDQGPGLSDAGFALIQACQELGILIDLAHLNQKGFWDVARTLRRPLVATHTAAHTLTATARNLTDDQIDAIGESQGVIGVNLHVADLRSDGRWNSDTPLERWAEHVAYIAERIGPQGVALGSDFDGALMPTELGDSSGVQKLVAALAAKGFGEEELTLFAFENWRRVLAQAWNSANTEANP